MVKTWIFAALAALAFGAVAAPTAASAAKDEVYTSGSLFGPKFAVGGYDPVAYFSEGKPVEGSDEHTYEYKDATWRFSSEENLEKFKADPEAYAPAYGGYCAYAVAKGQTASGDPEVWEIVDGQLYLNYNRSIKKKWEQDIPGHIRDANANWPNVLN